MTLILSLIAGKIIAFFSKKLTLGGGSAAPGLYALRFEPDLITKLSKQIPRHVVITGTNGKTTTSRMLAHFAKSNNLKIVRNHTGSNLERGVASTLINHTSIFGKIKNIDLAIWESDEASFNHVVNKISPQIIVFLNVFRDQLDRYGEVDSVVKKWEETLAKINPDTLILLNGGDENVAKLAKVHSGRVETFGLKEYAIEGESIEKERKSKKLTIEAKNIKLKGLEGSSFKLTINDLQYTINLPLPGVYQIYNFLASFAAAYHLNLNINKVIDSLNSYKGAFGRFEKISLTTQGWQVNSKPGLETRTGYIFLIKNPAGATQVFETIAPELKENDHLLIALNDNLADGTDVSWIWDANFETLQNSSRLMSRDYNIVCSGKRAQDLAVRLKYAGFNSNNTLVENNLEAAFKLAQNNLQGKLFILLTYTALIELQKLLEKYKIKQHYWKEER